MNELNALYERSEAHRKQALYISAGKTMNCYSEPDFELQISKTKLAPLRSWSAGWMPMIDCAPS